MEGTPEFSTLRKPRSLAISFEEPITDGEDSSMVTTTRRGKRSVDVSQIWQEPNAVSICWQRWMRQPWDWVQWPAFAITLISDKLLVN